MKKLGYAITLVIISVAILVSAYLVHLNGNSVDFSDTEARIVISGSMDGESRDQYPIPTIPAGSMVFISKGGGTDNSMAMSPSEMS